MSGPYILAQSAGLPDRDFATLAALARGVIALRDAHPKATDLVAITCAVARGALPSGAAVSVRLDDGAKDAAGRPRGTWLCYAFMPADRDAHSDQAARLMWAVDAEMASRMAAGVAA